MRSIRRLFAIWGGLLATCVLFSSWSPFSRINKEVVVQNDLESISAQMSKANTTYIIRYELDLKNTRLDIPEGCTLVFKGGSFRNGIISFNNTVIKSNRSCIFNDITTELNAPIQGKVRIDWFSNSENNDYINWANALCVANTLVFTRNKEYHFTRNTLGYSIIRRDLRIEGNNATIVLESDYQLKGSDYCALIYHTRQLTVKSLNFSILTSMIPNEGCNDGRKSIDLFYGEDPVGEEGDDISAYLENININVKYADSGLGALYCAKQGKRFVLKKCNLYTKESNSLPGGGSLAWFMFNKASDVSILIDGCYAEANGQDECIAINPSGYISDDVIIDAIISDCIFVNKFNDGRGSNSAGLISMHPNTEQTNVKEGKVFQYNVTIRDCSFKANGAATNVARFYAANGIGMNVNCYDTQFIYEGNSPFYINQMQNGIVLLTKDYNPITPCKFSFKDCLFKGKYILSCRYQDWENGEVDFMRCSFLCDSFVGSEEFSQARDLQEASFTKCDFHFSSSGIKMGFGSPLFYDCSFYSPSDSLFFTSSSSRVRPVVERVKVNGRKVPNIQKVNTN